jgi:hypothetical protein
MERPQPEPLTPSSSRPVHAPSFRTKQADFFSLIPTCPRAVISNEAGRLFLPHPDLSPHRHFERSRPIFSSAFAPANASACVERNLSSLRPWYAAPPRAGASPLERKHSEEKSGETRTARRASREYDLSKLKGGVRDNSPRAIEQEPSLTPGTPISDWRLEHERISRSSHRISLNISPTSNPSMRPCAS